MKTFTLDGHSSAEWNIGLSGSGTYGAPARKGESISVPGRNGALWVDDGSFENTIVTYPCWMCEDFDSEFDDFRSFLAVRSNRYYRLEDDYHPNEYRLARWLGPLDPDVSTQNKSGRFNVQFDCQPQRFLTSGEEYREISDSQGTGSVFINPTPYFAYPKLHVQGAGSYKVTFRRNAYYPSGATYMSNVSMLFTVPSGYSDIWIDTQTFVSSSTEEIEETEPGRTTMIPLNINLDFTYDFMGLRRLGLYPKPGNNQVFCVTDGYDLPTLIEIAPRWWTI